MHLTFKRKRLHSESSHIIWSKEGTAKFCLSCFLSQGSAPTLPASSEQIALGLFFLKAAAVNSLYRITSRSLCVALSRLVTILVRVPGASDKNVLSFPFSLACSGNLCRTFDRPLRAKNNSDARRAGKCAKHFLLLETSVEPNLSCFFLLLALFNSPLPPFPPDHSSLIPPESLPSISLIPFSHFFHSLWGSFNTPAHDQMLNSSAAS